MADFRRQAMRTLAIGVGLLAMAACSNGFDLDFRNAAGGFDTSDAVIGQRTEHRPRPDDRGIISYPNYQVAIARRGDTLGDVANRVGIDTADLARYNGVDPNVELRRDEVIALPHRVTEPSPETGAQGYGPIRPTEQIDITTLAGDALDRAEATETPPFEIKPAPAQTGTEPIRHKVSRGETAYSISRLYRVSVRSLADWNGLGPDLKVREGQYLLIPVASAPTPRPRTTTPPGAGTPTPTPPSASHALPSEDATVATAPASPNLATDRTAASGSVRLLMPVSGKIIRGYDKRRNEGIDIAAAAGTPVMAAGDGTVAAITRDTDQVPILVLRHAGNLLTVYANVTDITFAKGARVKRGDTIAKVRDSSPSFLHFEVREGFESVDPVPYLN